MPRRLTLRGELGTVRLKDIPLDARKAAAERAARGWGLTGMDALDLMLAAERPRRDVELVVDVGKIEHVMAGGIVAGPLPPLPPNDPWRRR